MVFKDVIDELVNRVQVFNEGTANLKLLAVSISQGSPKNQ